MRAVLHLLLLLGRVTPATAALIVLLTHKLLVIGAIRFRPKLLLCISLQILIFLLMGRLRLFHIELGLVCR